MSRRRVLSLISLWLFILLAPSLAAARHAPVPTDGVVSIELDRRSHPALTEAWDAVQRGDWADSRLLGIKGLSGAKLLHTEADWVLLAMPREQADRLAAQGVRVSPPRPRPPVSARTAIVQQELDARSLTPLQSLADAVNVDRMMGHLDALSTQLQTRSYNTTQMQTATQYVYDRFVEYGLTDVHFDTFTYNGYTIRNVVGVKTGATYPTRLYMVCGHLDSTSPQSDTLAPGAEDNCSGSVGVLEAARLLGHARTDATIYFVCFTAEEQGLIGSEHLATIADQQNWDLRGVLNMDMIGYDRAGAPDLWVEGFYGNSGSVALMDALETVANTYTDMSVYRYPQDGWGSDHESFNGHGFPAILAIDYDWDNYSCYHQTCDVVANIVPTQLRRMCVAVTVTGAQLAGLQATLGSIQGIANKTDAADDSGVTIKLLGTGYPAVVSGAGGAFLLPDLMAGDYTLQASATGYVTSTVPVTVTEGHVTNVNVNLEPIQAAEVRGVVSLQGGGAPTGAMVFAEGQQPVAIAGLTGSYDLRPIIPGTVVLSANYSGRMPSIRLIDVPSGQTLTGIDFVMKTAWTFEDVDEGMTANAGWQWGSDSVVGAHSGTKVWGTVLNANYSNCADYRLDMPPLDLRFYSGARLHYWQWYKTEATYDGGNIQVSTDQGTTWTRVAPISGYTDNLRGSCNVLAGQPGFGGTRATWSEVIVDLSAYAGRSIRVRFWFGSDGGTRDRGWYIDDISLEGTLLPSDVTEQDGGPTRPSLSDLTVSPNPFHDAAAIRFRATAAGPAWITVFDATGRRVRSLKENQPIGPGDVVLSWDGTDESGRRVTAGVYWVRVFADGRTLVRPVTLLK
jgi:hypothetical protein